MSNQNNAEQEKVPVKKTLYSDYGYIEVLEDDYNNIAELNNINFTSKGGLKGVISRKNIQQEIQLHLKTFHSSREKITFNININSFISDIVEKLYLIESEKNIPIEKRWVRGRQYRIFSTRIKIHELNPKNKIMTEKIERNEILLLLPLNTMVFSEIMKGRNIVLTKNNRIAMKIISDESQYVLSDYPFKHGKNYFEINLLTEPIERSVIIGVCSRKDPNNHSYLDVKNFYGFILSEVKKYSLINGKSTQLPFGEASKFGDRIGVMVEFYDDAANIGYYLNKISIGNAFTKIIDKPLFPCITLGLAGTRILISNQIDFPDV